MAQTARPLLLSGFMNNIRVGTSRGVLALAESDFRRRYPVPQFARGMLCVYILLFCWCVRVGVVVSEFE